MPADLRLPDESLWWLSKLLPRVWVHPYRGVLFVGRQGESGLVEHGGEGRAARLYLFFVFELAGIEYEMGAAVVWSAFAHKPVDVCFESRSVVE